MIDRVIAAHRLLLSRTGKSVFLGICNKLRKEPGGEAIWKTMMDDKRTISEKQFLDNVDPKDILDEGETWGTYRRSDKDIKFYKSSNNIYFFQSSGFEYIWKNI